MEDQIRPRSVAFTAPEERFLQWPDAVRARCRPADHQGLPDRRDHPVAARPARNDQGAVERDHRKSRVSGRTQLLSLFLEDLMDGPRPQSRAAARQRLTQA